MNRLRPFMVDSMRKMLAGILMSMALPAHAEQFDLLVDIHCGGLPTGLAISLEGRWWAEQSPVLSSTQINPRSLLEISQQDSGQYGWTIRTETRRCDIGKSHYFVDVTPELAPGFHPEGYCATRIGAKVVVREAGRIVAEMATDACTETDGRYEVTRMMIVPGRATAYTKIPSEKFFWPNQ